MTLENFTIKAQEAVQYAAQTAQQHGQQAIEPAHLLKGVLEKGKDVCAFIFQKMGANASHVETLLEKEIEHLPRVQGGEPYLSREANSVLLQALDASKQMGDEFVSIETLLLALIEVNSTASRIMKDAGINATDARKAIIELRQGKKVDSQSADEPLEVCQEPGGGRSRRQTRPRYRARRRNTARPADSFAAHKEQSYPHW